MILEKTIDSGTSFVNAVVRILHFFASIPAFLLSLTAYIPAFLTFISAILLAFFIAYYHDVIVEEVEYVFRCIIYPYVYEPFVGPILNNVIAAFYNFIVCWADAAILTPYTIVRDVLFDLSVECGVVPTFKAFAIYLDVTFKESLAYISSRDFLAYELDFSRMRDNFKDFFYSLQNLFGCGCEDLIILFTQSPLLPLSDQWTDDQTWVFFEKSFNGIMKILQETFRVVQNKVYPIASNDPRPNFKPAADLFCEASTGFYKSFENAWQRFFNAFVPFDFVFVDVFSSFDKMTCIMFQTIYNLINIIVHYDEVFQYFKSFNNNFWPEIFKEDVKNVLNMWRPSSGFDNITVVLPGNNGTMIISSYQLLNTTRSKPNFSPNPMYEQKTVDECMCITIERVLCDPLNQGVTCSERYNGTLFQDYDFCKFHSNIFLYFQDLFSLYFESTFHLANVPDFIVFVDRQPFTTFMVTSLAETFNSFYGIFRVVDTYGKCIQTILFEWTLFVLEMIHLFFKTILGLVTLSYFETSLPNIENFLTQPGDVALNMATEFLVRVTKTGPDTLLTCLKFILNTGFPVPPAGCMNGCIVDDGSSDAITKKLLIQGSFQKRLNPLYDYSKTSFVREWLYTDLGKGNLLKNIGNELDYRLDSLSAKLKKRKCSTVTKVLIPTEPLPPLTCGPNLPPCFDLSCFPIKITVIIAHSTTLFFRVLNAGFQSRNGIGSPYLTGTGCNTGTCLQTDVAQVIVDVIAPLGCLCNFIHLVIPPSGFPDPCCFFTLLGEGLSCIAQVAMNVITSLTNDTNYTYIKESGGLLHDFDIVLKITNNTFDCLCDFIRIIFGVILDVSSLIKNYDPCCIPTKVFRAIIEIVRLLGQMLISLATLESPESQCYFYVQNITNPNRTACEPTVHTLPILLQMQNITDVFLKPQNSLNVGACGVNVNQTIQDQDSEGIATCVCTLLNAVMAQIFSINPNNPNDLDCPVDLCCFVFKISVFIDETLRFGMQLISTFWQDWHYRSETSQSGSLIEAYIPTEFIEFFFCNEYKHNPIGGPLGDGQIYNPDGTQLVVKCGRIEPILEALGKVAGCLCGMRRGIGDIADNFLTWFLAFVSNNGVQIFTITLEWPKCLCTGGPDQKGILIPLFSAGTITIRQVLIAIRNLNNPSYWAPDGGSLTNPNWVNGLSGDFHDIKNTWISRFLTPIANDLCSAFTNMACLLSMILGNIGVRERYNLFSSIIRYASETVTRIGAMIEGFAKMFANDTPGGCVGIPSEINDPQGACGPQSGINVELSNGNLNSETVNKLIVAMLNFFVDALIGIGSLGCSSLCPGSNYEKNQNTGLYNPLNQSCWCYNGSPYKGSFLQTCSHDFARTLGAPDPVCPGSYSSCTLQETCGDPNVIPGTFSYCPRYGPIVIGYPKVPTPTVPFYCSAGIENHPEDVKRTTVNTLTWVERFPPQLHWLQVVTPGFGDPAFPETACHFYNSDNGTLFEAKERFGTPFEYQGVDSSYQPICTRSKCISDGFCKNDQNVACSENGPILDGVIIAALKYFRVLLNSIYSGFGSIVDMILRVISVIWQTAPGVIKFIISFIFTVMEFLTMTFAEVLVLILPKLGKLLGLFFNIFNQKFVLNAKNINDVNINDISQHLDSSEFFFDLFETNMDGCIDNPIPCFCNHFNMTVCNITEDFESVNINIVTKSISEHFDGATNCDSLVHHFSNSSFTSWNNIPYSERYNYIDCISKRVYGELYNTETLKIVPSNFFYSQDGWFNLFVNIKNLFTNHMLKKSKIQEIKSKRKKKRREKILKRKLEFSKELVNRAKIYREILIQEKGVDRNSPILTFLVDVDRTNHKYWSGYYHYIFYESIKNIKNGFIPLPTNAELFKEMGDGLKEIYHGGKKSYIEIILLKKYVIKTYKVVGEAVHDLVHNKARNFFKDIKPSPIPEAPQLIKNYRNGTLFQGINIFNNYKNINITFPNISTHIIKGFKNIKVKFNTLSWVNKNHRWTKQKIRNYNSISRLGNSITKGLWPNLYDHNHEKFIIDGNCKVIDRSVKVVSELVNFCVDYYRPINITETTTKKEWNPLRKKTIIQRNVYRRATYTKEKEANFLQYWVNVFEDIFDINYIQNSEIFINDMRAWLANTNDDISAGEVGFLYWSRMPFNCKMSPNLDCSQGIGLEQAIYNVTWWYVILFGISILIFPALMNIIAAFWGVLLYALIIMIVGFHYSPACIFLWPTLAYSGENGGAGTAMMIPNAAVPLCFMNEVTGLTNKYFTNNYTFLLNSSMVNGPTAPRCPERLDIVNCLDVGLGDGVQNFIYFIYTTFGEDAAEAIVNIASLFGRIFPSIPIYLNEILDNFQNASQTELEQFEICSKITILSITIIGLPMAILSLAFLFLFQPFLNSISAIWNAFRYSPMYENLMNDESEYNMITGEDEGPNDDDENDDFYDDDDDYSKNDNSISSNIASILKKVIPGYKQKKLKIE